MRTAILLVLLSCTGLTLGCQSNSGQADGPPLKDTPAPAPVIYPSISLDLVQRLYQDCTYMDYLLYNASQGSISQNEKASIQGVIRFISDQGAVIDADCKSVSRISFQNNGNELAVAEFFFAPGKCCAFVFLENGKPVAGNKLTEEGVSYFTNLFQQLDVN